VRLLRTLLVFKLGVWVGLLAGAAFARAAIPSRGDEESDEVALMAALNGIQLKSSSQAFRGGSMFSWFGGIAVDLRETKLAPDAHLDLGSLFGGIAIRVPPGWRVVSNVKAIGGGVAIGAPEPDDPEAPMLTLDGFTAFGGIAIGAKAPASEAPGDERGARADEPLDATA
jgi:hypothetical protein